jgi:hypothetical protein
MSYHLFHQPPVLSLILYSSSFPLYLLFLPSLFLPLYESLSLLPTFTPLNLFYSPLSHLLSQLFPPLSLLTYTLTYLPSHSSELP